MPDSIYLSREEAESLPKVEPVPGAWMPAEIRDIRRKAWDDTGANLLDEFAAEFTFKNWQKEPENRDLCELCRRYADKFPEMLKENWGLFFYGEPGTGKTFAAICIANALLERGWEVLVTSPMRLLEYMRGANADAAAMTKRLARADLLVLDDLGAERDTSYAMEQVYNLIDARYRAGKPMVVTSNETAKKLKSDGNIRKIRVYNRVIGCCRCVQVKGKDYRAEASRRITERMKKALGV